LIGLLKEMIPDDVLVEANSSLQTTREGFRLIGPLVGAALFGMFGGGAVAVVDSLSFLVAALIIASIPLREKASERSEQHWWHEMTGGIQHLAHEAVLRHVLVAFTLMLIVIGFTEASIYAVLDFFGEQPTFAGVVVSVHAARLPRHLRDLGRIHRRGRRLPAGRSARSAVSTGSPIDDSNGRSCFAAARGARVCGGLIRLRASRR